MPPPAATQAAARLWTARVVQLRHAPHLPRIPTKCRDNGNCTVCSWLKLAINYPASCKMRFTRGRVWELKNGHNSVTVQNRTHVYMNFFHHKDLGNHLLQLCPKVVKHPVYILDCQNGLMAHIQVFREVLRYFIFSFLCITTQLLQFESNNTHSCIKSTVVQHTNSFMFRNM